MEKTVIIISSQNFTLFKGLSQKDLTVDNKAEHNRLNIRPMWASRLDEEGKIQRIDFKQGENVCPDYVLEWESIQQLVDNGTLSIKGSLSQAKAQADTKSLEEIKKLKEELAKAKAEKEEALKSKEKAEAELKKTKIKTIE